MGRVRPARLEDCALLPAVERSAGEAFRVIGMDKVADGIVTPADFYPPLVRATTVFVAVDAQDRPVGLAACEAVGDSLYVHELAVAFEHQRRGLGVGLMAAARAWAEAAGLARVALRTFRDVPFNAPFYRKLGFVEGEPETLADLLATMRRSEADHGLAVDTRLTMMLELTPRGRARPSPSLQS